MVVTWRDRRGKRTHTRSCSCSRSLAAARQAKPRPGKLVLHVRSFSPASRERGRVANSQRCWDKEGAACAGRTTDCPYTDQIGKEKITVRTTRRARACAWARNRTVREASTGTCHKRPGWAFDEGHVAAMTPRCCCAIARLSARTRARAKEENERREPREKM